MNKDDLIAGLIIGAIIGAGISIGITSTVYQQDALKAGAAEYNQQTGYFQWVQPNKTEK